MKTEKAFLAKLLPDLRKRLEPKGAVIFKHNDFYTSGVPDFTITINGRTTWWEAKLAPNEPTKLQAHYLKALGTVGYVITYDNHTRMVIIQWKDHVEFYDYQTALVMIVNLATYKE